MGLLEQQRVAWLITCRSGNAEYVCLAHERERSVAVPNETKSEHPMNPLEFWMQWNEMATSIWTNAIHNDKVAGMDSSGFDSSWIKTTMKTARTVQERVTNNAQALLDPQEAWKLWLDTTMDIWCGAVNMGGDPLGMIAGWIKVMKNVQGKADSGGSLSVHPFMLFNEWYDVTNEPWSKLIEDTIASERFLEITGPFLEKHANLISTFRRASEEYFKMLRLPTLSDIAHVAELIVGLEEKVDTIEETIERVKEPTMSGTATMVRMANLEQRLNQIEIKLDRTIALLEKIEAGSTERR